ncbi:MAG: subtype B tannase [Rubrivivax sp.]
MDRRHFTSSLLAAATTGCALPGRTPTADPLRWDPRRYTPQQVAVGDQVLQVRAYEGLPVVARPLEPDYQALNLYVPEPYFQGGRVGAFSARTAPIFLPNGVGGYMPAKPGSWVPRSGPAGARPAAASAPAGTAAPMANPATPSAAAQALLRGYVVAAPGARGRTLRAADGRWTGKAPAAIVDLKAAVRWLRHNADQLPGQVERIVSNGTSAGGALSALLGASGNHPGYDAELQALGAAPGRDDVFAVSAFCPITNLAHADESYEWQFHGHRSYRQVATSMLDFRAQRQEVLMQLDDAQWAQSDTLRSAFVAYVNGLGLHTPEGQPLTLLADGSGPLRDHTVALLQAAAQAALDAGQPLGQTPALTVRDGRVLALDFAAQVQAMGRMKGLPAFDGWSLETGENQLFGQAGVDKRHFTPFSLQHSRVPGATLAEPEVVRLMDAMAQLGDARSRVAPFWRIRHGSQDRDTALAVPVLLAAAARRRQARVDLALPWGRPHSGDYELDALFAWVEQALASG